MRFCQQQLQRGITALLLLLLLSACSHSHTLLTQADYQESLQAYAAGFPSDARLYHPYGETNTFITTMEKTYLSLLQGKADIDALQRQVNSIENRVRYHISREAKTFFYLQTPEDYYASEHEILWMHFLLSWGYSLRGEYSKACVEARKSAVLLDHTWSEEGHFDDPVLRLMLGTLFTLCGDWREAQVDFRAAAILAPELGWAKTLAERDSAPRHLILILGGVGPEPIWQPQWGYNPLRTVRALDFQYEGRRSPLTLNDQHDNTITPQLSPSSKAWYERHLIRDNAIQELIQDTRYGQAIAVNSTIATAKATAAGTAGLLVGVGSIALGGGIAYLGLQASSGEVVAAGATVAVGGVKYGTDLTKSGVEQSQQDLLEALNPAPKYRYVRYLPEYLWLGWSDAPLQYPLQSPNAPQLRPITPLAKRRTKVSITHYPDHYPLTGHRAKTWPR